MLAMRVFSLVFVLLAEHDLPEVHIVDYIGDVEELVTNETSATLGQVQQRLARFPREASRGNWGEASVDSRDSQEVRSFPRTAP